VGADRGHGSDAAPPRQWGRTAETRRAFLDAARAVFTEHGFSNATVTDVVSRANASNGSLYHHFGGKSELFLALWQEYQRSQEERASARVAQARKAGLQEPIALFAAGARGFLEGNWANRDLTRLFSDGDGPPGFEVLRRTRGREWTRQNAVLLQADDTPLDRVIVLVLGSIIGDLGREVAECESESEAYELIDAVVDYVSRLELSPPPRSPRGAAPPPRG
jgi:AcrR family transcriptional regulator